MDGWPIAKGLFFYLLSVKTKPNSCTVQCCMSFTCETVMLTNFSRGYSINGAYDEIIALVDESFVSVLLLLITLFSTANKMKTYNFVNTLKELIKYNYPLSDDNFLIKVCMLHNMNWVS